MGPEKRLPLALFLCFVILVGWQALFAPPPVPEVAATPAGQPADGVESSGAEMDASPSAATEAVEAFDDPAEDAGPSVEPWADWVELGQPGEAGHVWARFDSRGGSLAELRFGAFFVRHGLNGDEQLARENQTPLVLPAGAEPSAVHSLMLRMGPSASEVLRSDLATVHWAHELLTDGEGRTSGIRFVHRDASGVTFEKSIAKVPGEFHLDVVIAVRVDDEAMARRRAMVTLVASAGMPKESTDNFYQEPQAVAALVGREPKQRKPDFDGKPAQGVLAAGKVAYFGTHNKYFAMLLRPTGERAKDVLSEADWFAVYDPSWIEAGGRPADSYRDVFVEGVLDLTLPDAGDEKRYEFVLYAGPKDESEFGPGDEPFKEILRKDLGFFDGIATLILGFLRFLHGIVGNWGWAIILLTLTVRALLFPLNRRMQTSMARHATKMKRVQPKLDAIKKKFAKDPQKLRQEQARIFQEEGAMPPLGGCLPMVLQIPIFFGLFSALRVAFDLRQQPFLGWIKDLSQPDRLAPTGLETELPLVGSIEYFNLLPILMVIVWVGQQRVMPKPAADNEQARQMQKIMMWMPILFGVFLYNYAAGLSLYMITTSLFGILEMTVIRRIWPIDDAEQPKKRSKMMARLETLQKRALEQQEVQRKAAQAKGGSRKRKR